MVPIIFITGSDSVAAGLVSSLNQPTGTATGSVVAPTEPVLREDDNRANSALLVAIDDTRRQRAKSRPSEQATAFLFIDLHAGDGRKVGNGTGRHECDLRMSMGQACQVSKLVSP